MKLASDTHPRTPVDVFVTEPFDFDAQYARALRYNLPNRATLTVIPRDTLIALKIEAGRPLDLADVHELRDMDDASP